VVGRAVVIVSGTFSEDGSRPPRAAPGPHRLRPRCCGDLVNRRDVNLAVSFHFQLTRTEDGCSELAPQLIETLLLGFVLRERWSLSPPSESFLARQQPAPIERRANP
jgi:hypothetical protein